MLLEQTPYDSRGPEVVAVGESRFLGMDASTLSPADLSPGYCSLILNGLVRPDGTIVSRPGLVGVLDEAMDAPIYGLAQVLNGGQTYLVFACDGKLYSLELDVATTAVELTHSGSTSFAFPSDGAGVRMVRYGEWLYGVQGAGGGYPFRTNGVTAELLTPAFSFTSTLPAPISPSAGPVSGAVGLGWADKFFIGDTATERNFSDGTTISAAWVKSTNATISGQRSKSNSDYAIQLDNDTADDQEYVQSDQTGSTDVSDNYDTNSQFARENHLFTVECEVAGSGGSSATPAVDAATPFAYVDAIVIPYSDSGGTTEISGGRITRRLGPVSERDGGKFYEVFDFRDIESRLGTNISCYRLRFEQPFTDPSGHAVGAHVNRVAWKAPGRVWDVRGGVAFTGSNVVRDGLVYSAGTFIQARDFVAGGIAATSNFRSQVESGVKGARWRVAVGIDVEEGVSAFRARAWARVGTSKTSTYGTTSVVYSTNVEVLQGRGGAYFFEFDPSYTTSGTNRYILQTGIEILDDIVVPGLESGQSAKVLTLTSCSLTGHLRPGTSYTYRYSFENATGGYEGVGTAPIEVSTKFDTADTSAPLNTTITGQGVTHLLVWRQGGDAPGQWLRVARVAVAGGVDTERGYWRLDGGVFEDYTPDEYLLVSAPAFSLNRDNPPQGAVAIATGQNRLWMAVGSRVQASWLYDASADGAVGRYWTLSPDFSDPEIAIKGSTFDLSSLGDEDIVHDMVLLPLYHPNMEGVGTLTLWRPHSVYIVTGTNPTNFVAQSIVEGEGVGVLRSGSATLVRGDIWAMTGQGLVRFDGSRFYRVGREMDGGSGIFGGHVARLGFHDQWVLVAPEGGSWAVCGIGFNGAEQVAHSWTQFSSSFTPTSYLSLPTRNLATGGDDGQIYIGGVGGLAGGGDSADRATPGDDPSPTYFSVGTRWWGMKDTGREWSLLRANWIDVDVTFDGDGTNRTMTLTASGENYGKNLSLTCPSSTSPAWRSILRVRSVGRDPIGVSAGLVLSANLTQGQMLVHGVRMGLSQMRHRYTTAY